MRFSRWPIHYKSEEFTMYFVTKKYQIKNHVHGYEYHKIIIAFKQHTKEIRGCFAFDIFEKIQPIRTLLFITYWQGIEYYRSYWERSDTKKLREALELITEEQPEIQQMVLRDLFLPESERWHRLYIPNNNRKSEHPGLLYQGHSHQEILKNYRPFSHSAHEIANHVPSRNIKAQNTVE